MTIYIDAPNWPGHDRLWSHLVSDESYEELHAFATGLGLPRRAFERDHYDVVADRYPAAVAAGARPVTSREIVAVLQAAGLRRRKRSRLSPDQPSATRRMSPSFVPAPTPAAGDGPNGVDEGDILLVPGEAAMATRLPHGYTNATARRGDVVIKRYRGPAAASRQRVEDDALRSLADRIPVPEVLASGPDGLRTRFVPGRHGQELLELHPAEVLRACGQLLARIQAVEPDFLPTPPGGTGDVLVHGDFGPNNVLLDPATFEVAAVVDWEWAHRGSAVEDLAWAEWIVRMHHPAKVGHLPALFEGYGRTPPATERREAMLDRCRELLEFTRRWEPDGPGVVSWRERLGTTSSWDLTPP